MEIYVLSVIFIIVFIVEFIAIKKLCNLLEEFAKLAAQQNALVNKTYQQNMALCAEKEELIRNKGE